MPRFHTDDAAQKAVRDAVLVPGFYGPISMNGRFVCVDKGRFATILQKRFAVDTILQRASNGETVAVEEKIVRWPGYDYRDIVLETKSCTVPGHESDGWMVYAEADWLNYAMCQADGNVLCHIIGFQKLKDAFWPVADQFPETISEQHNRTACRKVPLAWIKTNVPHHPRMVYATPEGAEIVKGFNATHYKHGRAA